MGKVARRVVERAGSDVNVLPNSHFDARSGENHFPKTIYPDDMRQRRSRLRPPRVDAAQGRRGGV